MSVLHFDFSYFVEVILVISVNEDDGSDLNSGVDVERPIFHSGKTDQ